MVDERRAGWPWPIGVVVAAVVALAVVLVARLGEDRSTDALSASFERAPAVAPLPTQAGLREGWNATAFINDNLWTEGDLQFAVWVDADGRPIVGRRRADEGSWHTADLGLVPGNPLGSPTAADAHNIFVIAVDQAGFVHVAGNMHATHLRYVRSERPFDIDGWTAPTMVGSGERSVTYPAFVRAPGGALLFFYRDGGAGSGDLLLNRLNLATGSWARVATIVEGRSSDESPYVQRVAVDPARGSIHLVFLWRAGEDAASNRDPSYLRSDDGGTTWRGSDGSPVRLPVTHRTAGVVVPIDGSPPVLLNSGGLAVDTEGRPHAVFRVRSGGSSRSDIMHLWQDRGGWRAEPVRGTGDAVGRPSLLGGGRDQLLMLWADRAGGRRLTLRVTRMDGHRKGDHEPLARLPVADWEPTFDSVAMVERSQLRMLLPLRRATGGEPRADAAVVTWSIFALAGRN